MLDGSASSKRAVSNSHIPKRIHHARSTICFHLDLSRRLGSISPSLRLRRLWLKARPRRLPNGSVDRAAHMAIGGPEEVGQDAFAALAEMKALLESNPNTDWTRVDLGALREHLVDMNRVVLDSETRQRNIEGGFEAVITGEGRTLEAILRMVPAHARFGGRQPDLDISVEPLPEGDPQGKGLKLRVTTTDTSSVDRLRGLGFFGFLVSGDHHRPHHLAMASGSGHP